MTTAIPQQNSETQRVRVRQDEVELTAADIDIEVFRFSGIVGVDEPVMRVWRTKFFPPDFRLTVDWEVLGRVSVRRIAARLFLPYVDVSLAVVVLRIDQDNLETNLANTEAGGVANVEYSLEDAQAAIK